MVDIACLYPGCHDRPTVTCLHCRKVGCSTHVRRYLIGGAAYADLCGACADQWRYRAPRKAPAPQDASARARV